MNKEFSPKFYAFRHYDMNVVKQSRSGGFFTMLSDYVFDRGGIVYACKVSEELEVVHSRIVNREERNKCLGSKYVQSVIGNSFIQAKQDLENGFLVLFSGTTCQIHALLKFLSKCYPKLLTLDILCHAIPSPKVYDEFISFVENAKKEKVRSVIFRDKVRYGWGADVMTFSTKHHSFGTQAYYDFFWSHVSIRPSCFKCKYKGIDRGRVDFTVGDFWGIEHCLPQLNDDRGSNMVICNSVKGYEVIQNFSRRSTMIEVNKEDVIQPVLEGNFNYNPNREEFFWDLRSKPFKLVMKKWSGPKSRYRLYRQKVKAIYYCMKNIWKDE